MELIKYTITNSFMIYFLLCFILNENLTFTISFKVNSKIKSNLSERYNYNNIQREKAKNLYSFLKEQDFRVDKAKDRLFVRAYPTQNLNLNNTHRQRPLLNTQEFLDKTIFLVTKAYDNSYTPVIKIIKTRVNPINSLYCDFEITIKLLITELETYKDIIVANDRFIKDDPTNSKYFPDPNTIKIRNYMGSMVVDVNEITTYEELALERNKKEFSKFTIENKNN